jgi:hypothetical protein
MKARITKLMARVGCIAVALALTTGVVSTASGAEAKTAKGGASELMKLKPIKTEADIAALKEGDSVVMSCPKCKTVYVTKITKENKPGKTSTVGAAVHGCPGCDTKLALEGRGKDAKDVIKHVCRNCGSADAFCCVLKGEDGKAKGMDKEAKN